MIENLAVALDDVDRLPRPGSTVRLPRWVVAAWIVLTVLLLVPGLTERIAAFLFEPIPWLNNSIAGAVIVAAAVAIATFGVKQLLGAFQKSE